jgi:outer membrane protein, heavy metal efflux system
VRAVTRRAALIVVAFAAQACVAHDAGYQDVRQLVAERAAKDVRWKYVEGEGAADKRVRELMAKPLTADSAVQVALLQNSSLQASFEDLGIARADLVSAYRIPNPTVEVALHKHPSSAHADIDVFVTEEISRLFFLPMRAGAAKAELDAAKLEVGGRVLDLALDVRVAYYRYVAALQLRELHRNVLLAVRAQYDAAKVIHDAGNGTDLDFSNQEASYQEARVTAASVEADVIMERERLSALLGAWSGGPAWSIHSRLSEPSAEKIDPAAVERRAVARSLDLELHRRRFTAAAKRANLAGFEGWVPELRVGVDAQRDERDWGWGPAAALEVPLFYQGQGEVARARAEMRREQRAYAAVAIDLRSAARAAVTRVETARDQVLFYKQQVLPLRQRVVSQTQLEYNAMHVGVFELLQAKRSEIDAARAYVQALRDYWVARAELDQLLAGRFRGAVGSMASAER